MNFELLGWLVALCALLFSIYTYFDGKKGSKTRLRVKFTSGVLTYVRGELSEPMIFLEAANIGSKSVIINTPNLKFKRKDGGILLTKYGSYKRFPHELNPGESTVAWYELRPLARSFKEAGMSGKVSLDGSFTSQVGDVYKAKKPYQLDVDDWAKE